jgi:hypothetical protein
MAVSGANTRGIKLLEQTLQSIIMANPEGMNVCLDNGVCGRTYDHVWRKNRRSVAMVGGRGMSLMDEPVHETAGEV